MLSFSFKTLPEDLQAFIKANANSRQVLKELLKNAARPKKKQRQLPPDFVQAFQKANIIFGWEEKTDEVNIFYMSTHADNEAVTPLVFMYHQDTEELDSLCTLVRHLKGRCEYEGTKAPEFYRLVLGNQRLQIEKPKD